MIKLGIGQDSHRLEENPDKPLLLGGVDFLESYSLSGNSDADVVLHALTNAISGITCRPVLGPVSDKLCQQGVTDSREYLKPALEDLQRIGYKVTHVSFTIECKKPKILPKIDEMRKVISQLLSVTPMDVAITATTGEGLTDFGKGLGIQVFAMLTAQSLS